MPLISKEFIDQLLFETDIVNVFQHQGIELQKKGSALWCKSPFKDEKTPSCQVKPATQKFYDFSTQKHGNSITLLMEKNNMTYVQAVEELAKMSGKAIQYDSSEDAAKYVEKREKQDELRTFTKAIAKKLQEELHKLPKTHDAWKEIKKRGYSDEEVKEYGLGFSPGSQFMYNLFSAKGAVEIGKMLDLITDKNQDKFFNCLVYPLYDEQDHVLGFARRRLDENTDFGKWVNPAETELYKKDRFLYGLNFAKNAILKNKRVWLVEGYNDVIAWQKAGITNTVATSGTAITPRQIDALKKLSLKVTICMDGDNAGRTAMIKAIPQFMKAGFQVDVCQLPDGMDPDDYSRSADFSEEKSLEKSLQNLIINGFEILMMEKLDGDELDRSNGIKDLVKIIANVPDYMVQTHYREVLQKKTKVKERDLKLLMQDETAKKIQILNNNDSEYNWPKHITTPPDKLLPFVKAYQIFQSDNRIYVQSNFDEAPYHFKEISNFSIDIVQHMSDEKRPMKLIRICNIKNDERIFDAPAEQLNTPQRFTDMLSQQGNYQWDGDLKELNKLRAFLFDQMGVGRKIDVLGWNPEGFYCWNNMVTVPGSPTIDIDKNGIFHFDGHTYYVPSANEIYKANATRYQTQKRIVLKPVTTPIDQYLSQMLMVHREFALIGMLFAFASVHQDVILESSQGFPIFFLYGPPSTGKDQLFAAMKAMYGIAATDSINLENNQSTGKAKIRKFAELSNMLVHLSEFTNHNKEIVGLMKGLWDRSGYTRGTIDSMFATETVPIMSSTLMTGNETPTDEAVLSRLLFGEMQKNQFSTIEKENFKLLNDMTATGTTGYLQQILQQRPAFIEKFGDKFNMYKTMLAHREAFDGGVDRLVTNYAILGATYEILRDTIVFPFSFNEMLDTFDLFVSNTRRKMESYSILSRFWDVVIAVMRGNKDNQLRVGRDIRLDGNMLAFNFTNVYNRIQTEWYQRNNETAPAKMTLLDKIKKDESYDKTVAAYRLGTGDHAPRTSVIIVNIDKIDAKKDLEYAIAWQSNEGSLFDSPATPDNSLFDEEGSTGDLRF